MGIRKVIAWVEFDPSIDDKEEAIQTLAEAVADDGAEISFVTDDE